ncbi:hypothetical protein VYU27_008352 [Nannochloropsis oceanica]
MPPSCSSSTPSISEQQQDPEAAALSAADAEKVVDCLERGLNKLFVIHGWCVSPADAAFLDQAWEELQPLLTYLPAREDQAKVETALQVAYHAHLGQVRRSGEPFVRHPIEVAKILCELGMDADSITAGLLHDTVEDTPVSVADVQAVFGAAVRRLVEGETKVSKLPKCLSRNADCAVAPAVRSGTEGGEAVLAPPMTDDQLANLLHLLMAMAQDFRVLVVKLADRLHNMRTLGFMSPAKQMKIARETLDVYVPLARKLGVWRLKTELEDLSFQTLHPSQHAAMTRALEKRHELLASLHTNRFGGQRLSMTDALTEALPRLLRSRGALKGHDVSVRLEEKQPYHLFTRNASVLGPVDTQPDLLTLKVVVSSEHVAGPSSWGEITASSLPPPTPSSSPRRTQRRDLKADRALCMMVMEEIQAELRSPSLHSSVRDFISFPLDNGYQALHDDLRVPGFPFPLEVHVSTDWMDQVAQFGLLALWDGPTTRTTSSNVMEQHQPLLLRGAGGISPAAGTASASSSSAAAAAAVPLELGWLQSLSAQTKRVVREEPTLTAQQIIGTLQEQLAVKRLVLTSDGEVLSLDVPEGEAAVTVREAATAQLLSSSSRSSSAVVTPMQQLEVAGASVNGQRVSLSRPLRTGDVVDFVYHAKMEGSGKSDSWTAAKTAAGEGTAASREEGEVLWIWQAPLFVWPWCLIGNADRSISRSSSLSFSSSSSSSSSTDLLSNKMWGTSPTRARREEKKKVFGQVKIKEPESVWDSGEIIWLRECELRHGRLALGVLTYGFLHALLAAVSGGGDFGAGGGGLMEMDITAAASAAAVLEESGAEEMFMEAATSGAAAAAAAASGATWSVLNFAPWLNAAFPPLSSLENFQTLSLVGAGEVLGGIVPETVAFNTRYQNMRRRRMAGRGSVPAAAQVSANEEASWAAAAEGGKHSIEGEVGDSSCSIRGSGLNIQQGGLGGTSACLTRTFPLAWLKEQERVVGRLGMVTTTAIFFLGAFG